MLIEPVQSRITGVWTTVIARKITGPNGEFLGAHRPRHRAGQFRKILRIAWRSETDAAISMLHRDGTLLARYPHVRDDDRAEFQDRSGRQQRILCKVRPWDDAHDQPDRRPGPAGLGSRALTNFPIVIIATTTVSAALADWREQTRLS